MAANRWRPLVALLFLCSLLSVQTTLSNYILPKVAERFLVLTDKWKLEQLAGKSDYHINAVHADKTNNWSVDIFRLAETIDSNSICTGKYEADMKRYLDGLAPGGQVLIQLVSEKKGGKLVCSGIWHFDPVNSWKRASQEGSRLLGLSAEEVRKSGSADGYAKKVNQLSEKNWQKMSSRL